MSRSERDIRKATIARQAEHDQDWEACKEWWRTESVAGRLKMIHYINDNHNDFAQERASLMAQLVLDRLLIEVWPGPIYVKPDAEGGAA